MDNKYIFSENLKRLMNEKGVSRRDIADILKISYFTVSDWVNGRKYPRMDKVEMLANYFGVLKSDLIEDATIPSDISLKIKELRLSRGMTLEQVGDIVGVGKSTVRKWETGEIADMKQGKIALLAKALSTTPAYLMGWFEEESYKETTLNEGERQLLELFRKVPENQQQMVLQMISAALKSIE